MGVLGCVCKGEKERERERGRRIESRSRRVYDRRYTGGGAGTYDTPVMCVGVCVCVCVLCESVSE